MAKNDDDDEVEKKEGISWRDIVRLIGQILIIIAGGTSIAAACAKVGPKFGISGSKAEKLFAKYKDRAK